MQLLELGPDYCHYLIIYNMFHFLISLIDLTRITSYLYNITSNTSTISNKSVVACFIIVIGDNFVRGLSGGEKKRASIASELLTDPDILLLDVSYSYEYYCPEPTSGLDSSIALSLINQLKWFASRYNKTVIVTIHQPSSQIYHLFDSLLLLTHGQVAYFGEAHEKPLKFMEKIDRICNPLYNPADFLIDLLKLEKPILDDLVQLNKDEPLMPHCQGGKNNEAFVNENERTVDKEEKKDSRPAQICLQAFDVDSGVGHHERWPTGFWTQFRMLTWRNYKQSKGRLFQYHDLVFFAVMSAIVSLLFFQIPNTADVFRDRMGLVCATFIF
ncbi:AB22G-like protein [Mya arenaria]|uniref:AB22G-like protein n=1 Tax=Mya arenaria TaxID=6604 RepID=A0ABY7DUG5_MYAAR|nr:AB22G-like protein [Mya arenaria]